MITAAEARRRSLSEGDVKVYQRLQDAVIERCVLLGRSDAPFLAYVSGRDLRDTLDRCTIQYTEEDISVMNRIRGFFFELLRPYEEAGYRRRWDTYATPTNERISWDTSIEDRKAKK